MDGFFKEIFSIGKEKEKVCFLGLLKGKVKKTNFPFWSNLTGEKRLKNNI